MKAIKPKSKKQKGSRLELKIAKAIRHAGLDDKASRMPLSGASWALKSDIYTKLPYAIECKNTERHNLWGEWDQARSQASMSKKPVLAISSNHRPILMCMDLDDWIDLLLTIKQLEEK